MNNYNIKFSIITVTYNAVESIEETILSVINQHNIQFEYIIIDGGSTDGTIDILKKYAKFITFWISEPDNGIYDAMNKGLQHASGDYVIFLGADDHFLSFSTLYRASLYMKNLKYVYYGDVYRNNKNDLYRGAFNKYILSLKNISHQAIFYPKHIYQRYHYDLQYKLYADYFLNLTLYSLYQYKYIPLAISYFNCNGISSSTKDVNFQNVVVSYVFKTLGIGPGILRYAYHIYSSIKNILTNKKHN